MALVADVAVAPNNHIFIGDYAGVIREYDDLGTFIGVFDDDTLSGGDLCISFAPDSHPWQGDLVVLERATGLLYRFDAVGNATQAGSGFEAGLAVDVTFGPDRALYVSMANPASRIYRIRTLGKANFRGLGDLPGGAFESRAMEVSDDGTIVVGWSASGNGHEAFRWSASEGMMPLGDLPGGGFFSEARAVSGDGLVVVGYSDSHEDAGGGCAGCTYQAFRWTSDEGLQAIDDQTGTYYCFNGVGASGDGSSVVGDGCTSNSEQGWLWTATGGMQPLDDLPGGSFLSHAHDISADGTVITGFGVSVNGYEAYRWTGNDGMQGLGDLPGGAFVSSGDEVSADGEYIGGWSTSGNGQEAFRWSASEGMQGLGDFPGGGFESGSHGVTADGSVVVGYGSSSLGPEAFIWTAVNGMQNLKTLLESEYGLDLSGWRLTSANDISPDGRVIVGNGINPSGESEAWIAWLQLPCGDLNGDLVVDLADYAEWAECQTGPDAGPLPAECEPADFDGDGDADLADFAALGRCFAE